MQVEVHQVRVVDEMDGGLKQSAGRHALDSALRRLLAGRPACLDEIVENRWNGLSRYIPAELVALRPIRGKAHRFAVTISPVHQLDRRRRRCARRHFGRHEKRAPGDARVVEPRELEGRARIVDAALEVRSRLQRAVPQLHASVRARRK